VKNAMQLEIKRQLQALADSNYQKFSQKLNPNAQNILGIRVSDLRKIAKQIVKFDWETYLNGATDDSFEEILLQGLVIGYARISIERRLQLINTFVAKIDNWGICDTFCGTIKIAAPDRIVVWNFLQKFYQDDRPFHLRFAIVMLFKFINEKYIDDIFKIISSIHHDNRYVKLAVAWLIAECCARFSEKTIEFLAAKTMDPWTQNTAIRKISESFRVDTGVKIWAQQKKYM
jgi:3-methyladenine DNA glycosylase AlkD